MLLSPVEVMKLVGQHKMAMSSFAGLTSLHAWLGQELEMRGIDAVIYTRYILSILQQDAYAGDDFDLVADTHFFPPSKKESVRSRAAKAARKVDKRKPNEAANSDERKKNAAVECLLSVSDEDCGIESLVDELYSKLKEQQARKEEPQKLSPPTPDRDVSSDTQGSDPPADPAQRYYAAFPALGNESEPKAPVLTLPPEGGVWAAKVTQGLARDRDHLKTPTSSQGGTESSIGEDRDSAGSRFPPTDERNKPVVAQSGASFSNRSNYRRYVNHRNSRYQEDRDNDNNPALSSHQSDVTGISHKNTGPDEKRPKINTVPLRSGHSKAWKEFEYMRPIFIVPKMRSPNVTPPRVRSVRTNQKTESVLDFFFKTRLAMTSPLLSEPCYPGYDRMWDCSAGCLSWQEMLGLSAESEDQSWYTEPLDALVQPSPVPSRRLYNRKSILNNLEVNWAYLYETLPSLREAAQDEEEHGLDALGLTALLSRTWNDLEEQQLKSQPLVDPPLERQDCYEHYSYIEEKPETATDENENVSKEEAEESKCGKEDGAEGKEAVTQTEGEPDAPELCAWVVPSQSPTSSSDGDASYMTAAESLPFPRSLWGGPSSPMLSSSDGETSQVQGDGSFIESLWSVPASLNASSSDLATGVGGGMLGGGVWSTQQSSSASPSDDTDAESSPEGGVWQLPFSGSESPWDCDKPLVERSAVEEAEVGKVWGVPNTCEITGRNHNLPHDSGAHGLGTGVWGATSSPSPATQGRQPTPRSAENEVLDDRPIFFLPLGDDHDFGLCINAEQDSPPPIPPLCFSFTDSEEEEGEGNAHLTLHQSSSTQVPSTSSSSSSVHQGVPPHPHTSTGTTDTTTTVNTTTSFSSYPRQVLSHGADIWKCDTGEESIPVTTSFTPGESTNSLSCDTCESTHAPWAELLLSTSLPYLSGKSGMRSTYLDSFIPTLTTAEGATLGTPLSDGCPTNNSHDFADLRNAFCLPLSPKHEGSEMSHLWDVNAVHRMREHMAHSGEKTLKIELEQIRRYLLNVRFEIPGGEQSFSFIEGGLYGSWLSDDSVEGWEHSNPQLESMFNKTLSPVAAIAASPGYAPYYETFTETDSDRTILWKNFSTKPGFFRQRSTSADNMDTITSDSTFVAKSRQPSSSDLLPSENSAFCDKIPPRLPQLPHVQSEPSLAIQQRSGQVYNHGRHVQVKSLYKSDPSILHQLGLATAREQQPSKVEVSPHTHFLPISNQDETSSSSTTDSSTLSTLSPPEKPTSVGAVYSQRVPTPTGPVPEVCPVLGRESSYQLYQDSVDDRELHKEYGIFVPRFQVQKTREKCCQTGDKSKSATPEYGRRKLECVEEEETATEELPPPETIPEERSPKEAALEMFLFDMKDVLELSTEEAERLAMEDAENYGFFEGDDNGGVDYSSDYESMGGEQVSMEDLGKTGIAELWEESTEEENKDEGPTTPVQPQSPALGGASVSGGSGSHYRSIWSCGTDQDLPSLPSSYKTPGTGPFGPVEPHLAENSSLMVAWSTMEDELKDCAENITPTAAGGEAGAADPEWPTEVDDVFVSDGEFLIEMYGVDPNPEPNRVIFSSDLEELWLNSDSSFEVQVPRRHQYPKSGSQKKPCSFFLEGNCRRTDCKFAHDISNITCRFWEGGECFKGMTCPFLHGYLGETEGIRQKGGRANQEHDQQTSFSSGYDKVLDPTKPQLEEHGKHGKSGAARRRPVKRHDKYSDDERVRNHSSSRRTKSEREKAGRGKQAPPVPPKPKTKPSVKEAPPADTSTDHAQID